MKTLKEAISEGSLKFKPWLNSFNPEIFEVDFSDVIGGRGPSIYLSPSEFFKNTFMTQRMKEVLQWCLTRTAGLSGKGVIYLATGFGGGKSHLLTLLYHTFKSKEVPNSHLLEELSLTQVPDVTVVAVDGHNLTFPMSKDRELKDYLKNTKEETIKALEAEGKPVVVLVDELVVYLAKLKEADQGCETAYFHTFLEAVKSTRNCVIVVTSPKGATVYGKESERIDAILDMSRREEGATGVAALLSRVTQPIVPVEKEDFISIIKKRLVDRIDSEVAREVENNLGRRLNIDFTDHYPFHPFLIDVLYNRLSLYPGFQKTRDVLKVIALAIKGVIMNMDQAGFNVISPSDLLFDDPDLRAILTNEKVFGSNLEQAVTQDVLKAARACDHKKVFGRYGRITSAIFMYSLHSEQVKRGASPKDVYQCLTDAMSDEDVKKMLETFYSDHSTFMWLEGGKYLFKSRQNVPNMIKIKANQVRPEEINLYIEKTLYSTVFDRDDAYCTFYPSNGYIPAPNTMNVAVCMYWDDPDTVSSSILSINGDKKNSAVVLIPEKGQKGTLEWYSKLVLGSDRVLKEVKGEKELHEEAKNLKEQYEANALQMFKGMYTQAAYLQGTAKRSTEIDPMRGTTIGEALVKRLKEAQKVVDTENVSPKDYLLHLLGSRKAVQLRALYGDVETMTSIPFSTRRELKAVIRKGVYEGAVGLVKGILTEDEKIDDRRRIFFRQELQETDTEDGDTLLTAEYAQRIIDKIGKPEGADSGPEQPPTPPALRSEQVELLVADAKDLYRQLNDKMTELLLNNSEARAEVSFSGTITGTVTAKDIREIRAIIDLADGISKASSLLGSVKITARIYKKDQMLQGE